MFDIYIWYKKIFNIFALGILFLKSNNWRKKKSLKNLAQSTVVWAH